ncbi:hypothetical protein [Acuticoccus sediminis]|uniref:hypothetical protein n=1 Tax=Acuticoccus sediminis TaxID=2184697 RepID=UPI001CFEE305|nr:hypothetical protein [Acuticoccus sediminis]
MFEHVLVLTFLGAGITLDALDDLEDRLFPVVEESGIGEIDGNDIAADGSGGALYLDAHDAEALFEMVRPILEDDPLVCSPTVNTVAILRFGRHEDEDPEERLTLVTCNGQPLEQDARR